MQEKLDLFARLRSQFKGPPLTSAEITAAIDGGSHPPVLHRFAVAADCPAIPHRRRCLPSCPSANHLQTLEPTPQAIAQGAGMGDGPGAIVAGFGVACTRIEIGKRCLGEAV